MLTGQTGQNGLNGLDGVFGGNSDSFLFFGYGVTGNPGATYLSFSGSNASNTSTIYLSDTDASSVGIGTWSAAIGTSNSTVKGFIRVSEKNSSSKFALYQINSVTVLSGYKQIGVTCLAYSSLNPFSISDVLVFSYDISGDTGTNGNNARTTLFNDLSQTQSTIGSGSITVSHDIVANTLVNDGDSVSIEVVSQFVSTGASVFTQSDPLSYVIVTGFGLPIAAGQYTYNGLTSSATITIDRISSTSFVVSSVSSSQGNTPIVITQIVTGADFTSPITIDCYSTTTSNNAGNIIYRKIFAEYKPI